MIRVALPYHLQTLAMVGKEVSFEVEGTVTQRSVLNALQSQGSGDRPLPGAKWQAGQLLLQQRDGSNGG